VNRTTALAKVLLLIERDPVLFHAANLVAGAPFLYWVLWTWRALPGSLDTEWFVHGGGLEWLFLVLRHAVMTTLLVVRRRSDAIATDLFSVAAALLGTWLPLLLSGKAPIHWGLDVVEVAALVGSVAGLASLGRSFGLIAANRGLKTNGLYRVVRHPVYASYVVFDAAFVLNSPSWSNALVGIGCVAALWLRARCEERVLMRDPAYRAYAERVRYRFVPHVL
jgi:protein-S-isoprenylcysteine O-methyltransferase Ste14